MSSDVMEVSALGRPFTLGMLYHAFQHKVIPGITLWDERSLEEHTVNSPQNSSAFDITTSDSIEDKSFLLDVDASLKASFLSGLVKVGGSAKFLNDKKKFHHQSRVILQYKATTSFKQLLMTRLRVMESQQEEVIEAGLATHVVTGILYGANAFFVFDSEKLDASSIQEVQGNMEAVIKKIPNFDVEGKVDIKLADQEKALTDKLSCKFYGDFLLESNPATFEKAVMTYISLPKLLGENGEKAVPLKVWLMPLKYLDSNSPQLMSEISVGLVRKVPDALEELHQLEKRCNDLQEVGNDFPKFCENLRRFQKLCLYFTSALQQDVTKIFPLIRAGREDQSKLEEIFEERDKSPFSHEKLTRWLDDKEREISIIRSCVDLMEGTKIVPNQSELVREAFAPGVEHALCYVFTSLETTDPFLDELADYMDQCDTVAEAPPAPEPWYFSDEVVTDMREKAKAFHHISKAMQTNRKYRFLGAAITNEKYAGASIYHYKDGVLITDDFTKPELPAVETIKDRSALIWYARDLTLDPDTAHNQLTLSEENKKATNKVSGELYPDLPQRFDHFFQVLCREELTGRCYWEVEWSAGLSEDVAVGVCYKGMFRKGKSEWCRLGWNVMSWCLGHRWSPPAATLYAEHNTKCQYFPLPCTGCTRLGVYLDWPGGTLSYYKVSSNTLTHLYTFHAKFSESVYPAFMIWREGNYVLLRL